MHRNGRWSGNRLWLWVSFAGLIVFLLIQIFPAAGSHDAGSRAISRGEAAERALRIGEDRFGIPSAQGVTVDITHVSDSAAVGYLTKEEQLKRYEKEWAGSYPSDVYRADLHLQGGGDTLTLFLHMESGRLVGWRDGKAFIPAELKPSDATPEQSAKRALSYASFWGVRSDEWEWNGQDPAAGRSMTFLSRKTGIADARLILRVTVPPEYRPASSAFPVWKNGSVDYDIQVPESFEIYMEAQQRLAGKLNAFGFVVPQLLLLIMAIVYTANRREYTSLRRGIGLAAIYFVLFAAFYFNLIPGFRAGLLEQGAAADKPALHSVLMVNMIVLAGMALFTYLSAVGGDGLWRSMGRALWPRWKEAGFGEAVLSGMKMGYPLAFLLLGVQSVILLALQNGIGMFQASDATQSAYNMMIPWLLLLLAWCAGISEELQSRLFGIGLFRHWLLNGARRWLGRKPSARAASALTLVAMVPPGLIWAFGHVGYAVYPAYSRLIELMVMGLLFGWFLLRFGLMAVIFAHVTLDSVLMGVQLAFDGLPGDLPAALVGFVLPAVIGYAIWWAHGKWGGHDFRELPSE